MQRVFLQLVFSQQKANKAPPGGQAPGPGAGSQPLFLQSGQVGQGMQGIHLPPVGNSLAFQIAADIGQVFTLSFHSIAGQATLRGQVQQIGIYFNVQAQLYKTRHSGLAGDTPER